MNLNSVRTSTQNTFISVTFFGLLALIPPITVIWRNFTAAPKMAFLCLMYRTFAFTSAYLRTAYLSTASYGRKFIATNKATSNFVSAIMVTPRVTKKTIFRIGSLIKFFSAEFADAIFARSGPVGFYASQSFVPWNLLSGTARNGTKFPVFSAVKFFIANRANVHNLSHIDIISQLPTYFAIAEKRIKQAQQQMLLPLDMGKQP